jgi:aldehyde:ferredoxin oxidoreductase
MLHARYGWDLTFEDVQRLGLDVLETEREFNTRAGVSEGFYDIPEFMREEPLPPRNSIYDIPMKEMQRIWNVEPPKGVF